VLKSCGWWNILDGNPTLYFFKGFYDIAAKCIYDQSRDHNPQSKKKKKTQIRYLRVERRDRWRTRLEWSNQKSGPGGCYAPRCTHHRNTLVVGTGGFFPLSWHMNRIRLQEQETRQWCVQGTDSSNSGGFRRRWGELMYYSMPTLYTKWYAKHTLGIRETIMILEGLDAIYLCNPKLWGLLLATEKRPSSTTHPIDVLIGTVWFPYPM
jgi:hypothetical protein